MNLYLVIIIGIIIFIFLFYKFYLIINYKFWAYQPVFHKVNLLYYILPNHIINTDIPKITRYCNFKNIKVDDIFKISDNRISEIVEFLNNNFTQNKHDKLKLTNKTFMAYFQGNKYINFVGRYYLKDYDLKDNKFMIQNRLIATLTTRNVNISLNKEKLNVYYVDNLCVDKNHRKKNIAASMIKTVEYKIRENNSNILVFLFKKEGNQEGIVPLCKFKIYQFDINNYNININKQIKFFKIKKENFLDLIKFITEKKALFKIWILPDLVNFQNLIDKNIYQIFVKLDNNNNFENVYILQDTNVTYKNIRSIELISSIITNVNNINDELILILNYVKNDGFKFLNINEINNNIIILNKLIYITKKYDYQIDCGYYIYNYKINQFDKKDAFILI